MRIPHKAECRRRSTLGELNPLDISHTKVIVRRGGGFTKGTDHAAPPPPSPPALLAHTYPRFALADLIYLTIKNPI